MLFNLQFYARSRALVSIIISVSSTINKDLQLFFNKKTLNLKNMENSVLHLILKK